MCIYSSFKNKRPPRPKRKKKCGWKWIQNEKMIEWEKQIITYLSKIFTKAKSSRQKGKNRQKGPQRNKISFVANDGSRKSQMTFSSRDHFT